MSPRAMRSGVRAILLEASMTSPAALGVPQNKRARVGRLLCLALALGGMYALLLQTAYWFLNPTGRAAFFPPAGLALGVLVLTQRRTWPLWLGAFATAHMAVQLWHDRPVGPTIWYTLANLAEPVAGALLLAAALRRRREPRAALVSFTLFPVLLAPALSAVIAASTHVLIGTGLLSWWTAASRWWVGDALGVLLVGSLILAWSRPPDFDDEGSLAAVVAVAAAAAAAIVVSGVLWHYPLVYIALPGLVWAAFVGGARAVTAVGVAAALAADWVAITGRAGRLVASPRSTEQLEFLQLFLGVTFLTGLVLATEIAERRRSEQRALEAQRQLASSEEAAIRLAEAERQSIMGDTHDIVGHGLNAMLLQVGAARRVLDDDPAMARELLASTEAIGRTACDDLDVALVLVGDEQARAPGRGLEQLPELVSMLRRAGLRVELRIEGERGEISTLVDWSAYRIVREALTNVLKHAPGASTTVTVRFGGDTVHLSVVNDGRATEGAPSLGTGRGIIGMRERVAAVGGKLDVGPQPGGGFTVASTLPTNAR
jgi:signal transduction histidine kinase